MCVCVCVCVREMEGRLTGSMAVTEGRSSSITDRSVSSESLVRELLTRGDTALSS